MTIRNYQPSDRSELSSMMRVFYDSPALIGTVPQRVIDSNMDQLDKGSPYMDCWLFEMDGAIAGYSILAKSYSTEAGGMCVWIEDIYLKPEFRGKGIGRAFFSYVENTYRGKAARLRLEAEEENENAIRFYHRNGYKELGYVQLIMDYEEN